MEKKVTKDEYDFNLILTDKEFKDNQDRVRTKRILESQLKKDRKRFNRQKIRNILIAIICFLLLIGSAVIIGMLNSDFMETCTKTGMSEQMCMRSL